LTFHYYYERNYSVMQCIFFLSGQIVDRVVTPRLEPPRRAKVIPQDAEKQESLRQHFLEAVELISADAAADEQKCLTFCAGKARLGKPGMFPNVRIQLQDGRGSFSLV